MKAGEALNYLFRCHQIPERSFFFRGRQFPICARCTGILLGYLGGGFLILWYQSTPHIPFIVLVLMLLPLGIDGGAQYLGFWKSTNLRRLFTGIWAGLAIDFMLVKVLFLGIKHGKLLYQLFL